MSACGVCGFALPRGVPEILCPRCRLSGALVEESFPSERVVGRYELIEELGRGGMGVVYRAQPLDGGAQVAMKTIAAGELATPEMLRRFRNEAEAAAGVQHPHLVAIREVGEHEGMPFLVMTLIEGRTLAARLAEGAMPPREAAELMRLIAQAVGCVHAHGILHRDLKPSNVLLDAAGHPFVSDFGLAKLPPIGGVSELTRTGQLLGSPAYMPPEQARGEGKHIGPEADVYALGAILYHALTGRAPFEAASVHELLEQVETRDPVAPRRLRAEVPRDLETICLSCLEKEPAARCRTALDLADDLGRWLDGTPIRARRPPLLRRPLRWARRRPVVAALAVVSLVLIANVFLSHRNAARQRIADATRTHTEALAEARKHAASIEPGRRARGLDAVKRGADSPELRDTAIALLTATSFSAPHAIPLPKGARAFAFSTNLDFAAYALDGKIHILRTTDGSTVLTLDEAATRKPDDGPPGMIEFSPDGGLLAVQSANGLLRVWRFTDFSANTAAITKPPAARLHGQWQTTASAANGFVSAFTKKDLGIALRIPPGPEHPVGALATMGLANDFIRTFQEGAAPGDYTLSNPRFPSLALYRDGAIHIIELQGGGGEKHLATIAPPLRITRVAWQDRGGRILIGCSNGGVLLYSNAKANFYALPMIYPGHSAAISHLAFCADTFTIVSASEDGFTRVSAGLTNQVFMELSGVTGHRFSRDGATLAGTEGSARLLLWKKLAPIGVTHMPGVINAFFDSLDVDFAPDTRRLLTDCGYNIELRDEKGALLGHQEWAGRKRGASLTPDGTQVLTADSAGFQILDATGPKPFATHTALDSDPAWKPRRFCFGKDGTLAIEADDGRYGIARWPDVKSIRPLEGRRASDIPGSIGAGTLAVSPDGAWIAAGFPESGPAVIWDTRSGAIVKELPSAGVVHFSPDGRSLLLGGEGAWHLYTTGTWGEKWRIPRQGGARQLGVAAFAEDGRTLALDTAAFTLTLLDTHTARVLGNFPIPEPVTCTSVRLHSGILYAGTRSNTTHRWDLAIIRHALREAGVAVEF